MNKARYNEGCRCCSMDIDDHIRCDSDHLHCPDVDPIPETLDLVERLLGRGLTVDAIRKLWAQDDLSCPLPTQERQTIKRPTLADAGPEVALEELRGTTRI